MLIRLIAALSCLLAAATTVPAAAQSDPLQPETDEASAQPLRVAIAERPPFAMRGDDGSWQGVALNLWRTTAEANGYDYEFVETEADALLGAVDSGGADLAFPVYVTQDSASRADLVLPFYTATLGVAEKRSSALVTTLSNLFSWTFLRIILSLSVLLFVVGAIIWAIERHGNEDQFRRKPLSGLGDGFWWAGVTLTTIGYGDKAPMTVAGRAVAMLWMLIGLAVSAALTAAVVSAMNVSSGPSNDIGGYVGDKSVGAVEGTSAFAYLERAGLSPQPFDGAEAGLRAVGEGDIDLFVDAAPLLLHHSQSMSSVNLRVSQTQADPVAVTIALPEDSDLAEPLERAVVDRVTTAEWWDHVDRWVPDRKSQ